jgi:hypothetical protein
MNQVRRTKSSSSTDTELEADVLVIGGGPAGTWAALEAVRNGATNVAGGEGILRFFRSDGGGRNHGVVHLARRRQTRDRYGQPLRHGWSPGGLSLDGTRAGPHVAWHE